MTERSISTDSERAREELFIALYKKAFPSVARYVSRMGGSFDQAKDIFQDALVIYYEKSVIAKVAISTSEQAYILGIAKHLWIRTYNSDSKTVSLNQAAALVYEDGVEKPSSIKLMRYLETAGRKCMELLNAFYYHKQPLATIADTFGFSGIRSATVQKYKCLEKVRNEIKEKALIYEDFLE